MLPFTSPRFASFIATFLTLIVAANANSKVDSKYHTIIVPRQVDTLVHLLSGIFLGALLTLFFGGALVVQIWHYYERFGGKKGDKTVLQCIVAALLFFSLLQNATLVHRLYDIHVLHFNDFGYGRLTVGWEIACSFVCIALMSGIVQAYYAHRVWLAYQKSLVVFIIFSTLITFTFAGGLASAVLILLSGSAANVRGESLQTFASNTIPWEFSVVFATWLCVSFFIDISLCGCLMHQLSKMKSTFFHTRHAVSRLLLLSLETCFATSAFSLISMIMFLTIPYISFYNILLLPIGQVAASSFLVTLMARPSIARGLVKSQIPKPLVGVIEGNSSFTFATSSSSRMSSPKSITKFVIKKLTLDEEKKRAKGDGSGVKVVIHREALYSDDICRRGEEPYSPKSIDGVLSLSPASSEDSSFESETISSPSSEPSYQGRPQLTRAFSLPLNSRRIKVSSIFYHPSEPISTFSEIERQEPVRDLDLTVQSPSSVEMEMKYGRTPRGRIVRSPAGSPSPPQAPL